MKEIINIHIGQAGVQIGDACWELFCREHNIQPDGTLETNPENAIHSSIFSLNSQEKYTPRSLFVDLDLTTIDILRKGSRRELFNPEFLVSGKEDAADNYARGNYTVGREIAEELQTKIRKLAEACDNLGGFMFTHSINGGTGSGLFTRMIGDISENFPKKQKQSFTLYPSPNLPNSVVEPYNAVLSTNALLSETDSVIMLDNQAIYNLLSEHLNIEAPNYTNVNRLIAQLISSSTISMRFSGGSLNTNLQEFHTNLIPFKDLHFLVPSLSPLIDINKEYSSKDVQLSKITESAFSGKSSLLSLKAHKGKYLACSMMYRGDVAQKEVVSAVQDSKAKFSLDFIDWVSTGIKTGVNPFGLMGNEDMKAVSRSLYLISNHTAVKETFKQISEKFGKMFFRRFFAYWYVGEGMEEGEFYEQNEQIYGLMNDYENIEDH